MTARPAPSALRQLALDYATGQLARGDYLTARRHLLDALQANAASAKGASNGNPPPTGCDGKPVATEPTAPPTLAGATPAHPTRPWPLLLGTAVGVLVLLGGGGYALLSGPPEPAAPVEVTATTPPPDLGSPAQEPPAAGPPTTAASATAPNGVDLIDQLLQGQRLWDATERRRFLRAWQALSPNARAAARDHPAFLRLTAELALLVDTERAGGADELVDDLLAFAATIDDGSPGATLARARPLTPGPEVASSDPTTRDAAPPVTIATTPSQPTPDLPSDPLPDTQSDPIAGPLPDPAPGMRAAASATARTNPQARDQTTPIALVGADQTPPAPPADPVGSTSLSASPPAPDARTGTHADTAASTSADLPHPPPSQTALAPTPLATGAADASTSPARAPNDPAGDRPTFSAALPTPLPAPGPTDPRAPAASPGPAADVPAPPAVSAAINNDRAPAPATAVGAKPALPTATPGDSPAATPDLPGRGDAPAVIPRPEPTPAAATGVAARLPRSATADPCTRSIISQPDRGPSIPCQDQFVAGSPSRLELRVVPAAVPFAITEKPHNLTQWCLRNDAQCQGAADEGTIGAAYSRWMSQKTGRAYRPATAAELRQAGAYDPRLGQVDRGTIRLVRPLEVTGNDLEATRLDLWWRRFHRP